MLMFRKIFFFFVVLLAFSFSAKSQKLGVKTNLLYLATTTPNIGVEFRLSKKMTFNVDYGENHFEFRDNKKLLHRAIQPELRFWNCESFLGGFWGIHLHGGMFNVNSMDMGLSFLKSLKDARYEGYFYGGGINYGYHWIMSNRFALEAVIGVGYAKFQYDKYMPEKCGKFIDSGTKDYFGITKLGFSIMYFIN